MATVIAVYNSDGCVGRCDAKCHNSTHPKCTCICGGKNHGAGLAQAVRNNEKMVGLTPGDLERYAEAHNMHADNLVVMDRLRTNKRTTLKLARSKLNPTKPGPDDLFGLTGGGVSDAARQGARQRRDNP